MQSSAIANLPYGGKPYCALVAASNSLAWLEKMVMKKLLPKMQSELAKILGEKYMNTANAEGASIDGFLLGIEKYIF